MTARMQKRQLKSPQNSSPKFQKDDKKYTSQLRAAQSRYKEQNQTTRLGTLTGGLFDLDDFAVHLAMAV